MKQSEQIKENISDKPGTRTNVKQKDSLFRSIMEIIREKKRNKK